MVPLVLKKSTTDVLDYLASIPAHYIHCSWTNSCRCMFFFLMLGAPLVPFTNTITAPGARFWEDVRIVNKNHPDVGKLGREHIVGAPRMVKWWLHVLAPIAELQRKAHRRKSLTRELLTRGMRTEKLAEGWKRKKRKNLIRVLSYPGGKNHTGCSIVSEKRKLAQLFERPALTSLDMPLKNTTKIAANINELKAVTSQYRGRNLG